MENNVIAVNIAVRKHKGTRTIHYQLEESSFLPLKEWPLQTNTHIFKTGTSFTMLEIKKIIIISFMKIVVASLYQLVLK